MNIWRTLGIASTRDRDAIRRAYAAKLKTVHPEDDAEGFQALRAAYEQAMRMARTAGPEPEPEAAAHDASAADAKPSGDAWADPQPSPVQDYPAHLVRAEEIDDLNARLRALHGAIEAGGGEAALQRLRDVLAASAMDAVAVRVQAEHVIGMMILDGGENAAHLIDVAAAEFRWRRDHIGDDQSIGAAVRARQEEFEVLARLRAGQGKEGAAFRALTQPPTLARTLRYRFRSDLPGAVRELLDLIHSHYPRLAGELDDDAVRWWSDFLDKPQVGAGSLRVIALLPLWYAFRAWGPLGFMGLHGPAAALAAYAASLVSLVALYGVAVYGVARRRIWWRAQRAPVAGALERYGWAPLAIANLFAAAAAPVSPLSLWAGAPFGLAAVVWAGVTAADDGPVLQMVWRPYGFHVPFQIQPWLARALGLIPLALVATFAAADETIDIGRLAVPLVALGAAFVFGYRTLADGWRGLSPPVRRGALLAVGLAAAITPLAIWAGTPSPSVLPLGLPVLATLMCLERVAVLDLPDRAVRNALSIWGCVPAFFIGALVEDAGQIQGLYLGGALWLMAAVVAGVMTAIRHDRFQARRAEVA